MGGTGSKIDDQWVLKEGMIRLWHGKDFLPTDEYWESFFVAPLTAEEVFNIIRPNDLCQLTRSDPPPSPGAQLEPKKNLETLIYNAIARLKLILAGSLHQTMQIQDINQQILNCMRILTRLLPFIYQAQHLRDWHDRFFWQNRQPTFLFDKTYNKRGRLFDGLDPNRHFGPDDLYIEIGPPLGETLIDVIVKLFFLPSFAVPRRYHEDGSLDLEPLVKLWQSGIGTTSTNSPSTRENTSNQAEIVRLLLALCSKTMYLHPNQVASTEIKALTYLTTKLNSTVLHGVLCSLLNLVMKYNPFTWGKALSIDGINKDSKNAFVPSSLHLLMVLIVYRNPNQAEGSNQFRTAIGKLHKMTDFQFIHGGVNNILAVPLNKMSMARDKTLSWAPEMMSLFWELVQTNRRFRRYLIDTECALDYVVVLVWYALDARDAEDKQSILRMCVFILQDLSADPTFGEKLNIVFRGIEQLPTIVRVPKFHGTYGDFLICSVHSIFAMKSEAPWSAVHDGLLTILSNAAPVLKNLAKPASRKIMDLFFQLSSPDVLVANGANAGRLGRAARVLDVIVKKHCDENRKFVDVIIANSGHFKALRALTFGGLVAEADRLAQQRKDRGGDVGAAGLSASHPPSEYVSSSVDAHAASVGSVPEDSAFAIGEDDEEAEDETPKQTTASRPPGEEGVQSPEPLSEKRRGKQPAVYTNEDSRAQASGDQPQLTTSSSNAEPVLPASNHTQATTPFVPTQDWFDSWHPYLPLDSVMKVIHRRELLANTETAGRPSTEDPFTASQGQEADSASVASVRNNDSTSLTDQRDGQSNSQTSRTYPDHPKPALVSTDIYFTGPAERGESFGWTPVAIGWYNALLWSRIYLQEAETFQGAGGLYASTDVKLFKRASNHQQISLMSPRGAIDAVGASLAQRISSFSMK